MKKTIKIILLFLPFITQCMKRKHIEIAYSESCITHNLQMQELEKRRDELKKELNSIPTTWWSGNGPCPQGYFLKCTYFHHNPYNNVVPPCSIDFLEELPSDTLLKKLQEDRSHNKLYSALGSAAITEKISFHKKCEYIQKLLALNFTPTPEDKKLAMLATYEEFEPSIIQKKLLLQHAPFLSEMYVPQDVINYIVLYMFKKELLF